MRTAFGGSPFQVVEIRIYFRADFFQLPEIFAVHLAALAHSDVRNGELQRGYRQVVLVVPVLDVPLFYLCEVADSFFPLF